MSYTFKINENSPEITISKSIWTGKKTVLVNNEEIKPLSEKGKPYTIRLLDGTIKKMYINTFFDFIPKVIIDGQEILLAPKLLWYEVMLCMLPLPLVIGGAIGGGFAAGGFILNLNMMRSDKIRSKKIAGVIFISLFSYIGCIIIVSIVQFAFKR